MEPSRSKRQSLMQSFIPPCPDLPAIFESLNDDTLTTVLQFVGDKSYRSFGGLNKHCKEVYLNTPGMTKKTFLFGYAPLSVIRERYENLWFNDRKLFESMGKGVVLFDRMDILDLTLQLRNWDLLERICNVVAGEGRIDLLDEVFNNIDDEDKRSIFLDVDYTAATHGKLEVLKWLETKRFSINKDRCARASARFGHLNILKFLKEEQGFKLDGYLYSDAIKGDQLHVMKWLREQKVDWYYSIFQHAAKEANLDVLQWIHDEGCPWDPSIRVPESWLKPEVVGWCRVNGYGDRIIVV